MECWKAGILERWAPPVPIVPVFHYFSVPFQEAPILKHAVWFILVCLSLNVWGCTSHPSLGEPVNDASRRAALLQARRPPEVTEAVFRTLIRWPGREISLTEIVKVPPEGGFRAAGITDLGSTLYAVQVDPNGQRRVLSKSLPFSDRWLLDGLVAQLLIPWNGPHEASQLYRQLDGTWTLAQGPQPHNSAAGRGPPTRKYALGTPSPHQVEDDLHIFIFGTDGSWQGVRRFSGGRLRYRASLEWDGEPIPKVIRVDDPRNHYHTVRERVSLQ